MNLIKSEVKTMSSREIAELTNKQHGHVKRDIEKMALDLNLPNLDSSKYKHNGNEYSEYLLNEELTLTLVSGYNVQLRNNVIKRWQELEAQQAPQVPQTYAAALLEAGRLALENEQLQLEAKENAPKVEFYEQVTGSTDTIDMAQAAKVLNMGIGRNRLFKMLREKKVLQNNNQPYQEYVDRGYFRLIETSFQKPDGSTHISIKTVVYQKGLDYIRKVVG